MYMIYHKSFYSRLCLKTDSLWAFEELLSFFAFLKKSSAVLQELKEPKAAKFTDL